VNKGLSGLLLLSLKQNQPQRWNTSPYPASRDIQSVRAFLMKLGSPPSRKEKQGNKYARYKAILWFFLELKRMIIMRITKRKPITLLLSGSSLFWVDLIGFCPRYYHDSLLTHDKKLFSDISDVQLKVVVHMMPQSIKWHFRLSIWMNNHLSRGTFSCC
jgi:hypothetical protein